MPSRGHALEEFGLPAAPQHIDELAAPAPGADACRVHAPSARFLLLCSANALTLAFEATLFDLLAESRYPAPRPRRARGGSLIAILSRHSAASCYAWPPGEPIAVCAATAPQVMEVGRLLARLHQLGEAHPAAVADPCDCAGLLGRLTDAALRDRLAAIASAGLPALPTGAAHGGLRPERALFIGDRCSAVLPSGLACAEPLVLDLADAAASWMAEATEPAAALRALVSGYQALRRLVPEERDALYAALRFAAAREAARRSALGQERVAAALDCVEAVGEREVRAAAG